MATGNCYWTRILRPRKEPISSVVDQLGDDMLREVLLRLPDAKCAFRFKIVCKRWNSVISDPLFGRLFRNGGETTLMMPSDDAFSFIPVPDQFEGRTRVFYSVKDLLLCGFLDYSPGELGRSYLVCNPVTKQWIALPVAPARSMNSTDVVARLVCEPLSSSISSSSSSSSNSNNRDQGDGREFEYRFRVVCMYQWRKCIKLDVFCSESGKWTKEALVVDGVLHKSSVVSNNGELFWWYREPGQHPVHSDPMLARFNPFRLDVPPTTIDASAAFFEKGSWDIAVSQDALHVVAFDERPADEWSRNTLSVWRLEEGCKSWREQYRMELDRSSADLLVYGGYECGSGVLHWGKPEVVFLPFDNHNTDSDDGHCTVISCNLSSGKVKEFSEPGQDLPHWPVFQVWYSCWPTPIPRYQELKGLYDGHYAWLV